jgi:nucleoside-diphosphate-sugar epimerase
VRIFLAGASGILGRKLVPLLVQADHHVTGMTRSADKAALLRSLGAEPLVCDVYDAARLRDAVVASKPDLVMHQLTDLPDDVKRIPEFLAANSRIRREGTRNLLAAAQAAGAKRFLAQSIAWQLPGDPGASVREHEQMVLEAGGVVLRYGRFYGPGAYQEEAPREPPFGVSLEEAARRTVEALEAPSGILVVLDSF